MNHPLRVSFTVQTKDVVQLLRVITEKAFNMLRVRFFECLTRAECEQMITTFLSVR